MSKGLEALNDIKNKKVITCEVCDSKMHDGCLCCQKNYKRSEQIVIIEKELKALETIKKKRVDLYALVIAYDLEDYNEMVNQVYELTQQEYDLLKEWVKE